MDQSLKQRLVGAIVLVLLAVIFVPMLLDGGERIEEDYIPPEPELEIEPPAETGRVEPQPPSQPPSEPAAPPAPAEPEAEPPAPARAGDDSAASDEPATQPLAEEDGGGEGEGWIVQLASFTEEENAVRLRDQLQGKGYSAFIEQAKTDEGTVYRVRVGPEVDRARARALREAIAGEVDVKGMVMRSP